jgi:hypothetical protein
VVLEWIEAAGNGGFFFFFLRIRFLFRLALFARTPAA